MSFVCLACIFRLNRALIPSHSAHLFLSMPYINSGTSCTSQAIGAKHEISFQFDFVGVVEAPIEGAIGDGGFTNSLMPVPDAKLTGHNR